MNVTLAPLHWCLDNVEWNRSDFYWLYFCHFLYWDLTILSMLSLQRHKLPISCLELFFCIHGMSKHFQMTIRENNFNNYIISTIQTECQYLLSLPKNRSFVKMFTFWKNSQWPFNKYSYFSANKSKFSKPWCALL